LLIVLAQSGLKRRTAAAAAAEAAAEAGPGGTEPDRGRGDILMEG
jgi:hypothetical protein